jgi:hypothetical protein
MQNVTKSALQLGEKDRAMYLAQNRLPIEPQIAKPSIDCQIRDFIAGRTNGEGVLHALYDHVLDEPVPQRLRALLQG